MKTNRMWIGVGVALLLLAVIGGTMYVSGWRLQGLSLVKVGSVELSSVPANSQIFVNDRKKETTGDEVSTVTLNAIAPGRHTIIVGKEGFRPWVKILPVRSDETTIASAFMVPRDAQFEILSQGSERHQSAQAAIADRVLPNEEDPVVSIDGSVAAWVSNGTIYARWQGGGEPPFFFCDEDGACDGEVLSFAAEQEVRDLAFYSGRNDVVIIAVGTGIYAVGLDRRPVQNVLPILEQQRPIFALAEEPRTLFISDAGALVELTY